MTDAQRIRELFPELEQIADEDLRERVVAAWEKALGMSGLGDRLAEVPFELGAPAETLITHIRKVTRAAMTLAGQVLATGKTKVDMDLLVATCLLHDVDKVLIVEPAPSGRGWQKSAAARRVPHGVLGAMICREVGLPEVIIHLVVTHMGNATLTPEPFEGIILHYADFFAADWAMFEAGAPLFMSHHR